VRCLQRRTGFSAAGGGVGLGDTGALVVKGLALGGGH